MSEFDDFVSYILRNIIASDNKYITREEIDKQIKAVDSMLQQGILGTILFKEIPPRSLTEEEKVKLKRTIETRVNVVMDTCVVVKGKEQQSRDSEWWIKQKGTIASVYWDRYKQKLNLPPAVVRTLDQDTDTILGNLFNPQTSLSASRYGMVFGQVQAGKTGNYSGLICKAADAGYKCFIIIAGIHNNLRNQTQVRLKNIFSNCPNHEEPLFLTTDDLDFNKSGMNRYATLSFENYRSPIFMVIKKNTSTLENVLTWLNKKYPSHSEAPLLLIDDEADNASINTGSEENPTVINAKIRKLLQKFTKAAYVGYTATPFANIFIDDDAAIDSFGKDLFPEDFIIALDAPDNYHGAKKYFLDDNDDIRIIDDYSSYVKVTPKTRKNPTTTIDIHELPPSLKEAIHSFFINIAVCSLRKLGRSSYSMLVHTSRLTLVHKTIAYHIDTFVNKIKKHLKINGLKKASHTDEIILQMENIFASNYDIEFSWEDVLSELNHIFSYIRVIEEHSESKDRLVYSNDELQALIVVGGNSLARGFTIEGLTISYFVRRTCAADTLMQMGRWFGYRDGYSDLCRVYITETIRQDFQYIAEASLDLIAQVKDMREEDKTPRDFGLCVQRKPGSFLITARNKMKSAHDITMEICLDGYSKESSWISSCDIVNRQNLEAMRKLLSSLNKHNEDYPNKFLFEDVPSVLIHDFLNDEINGYAFLEDYVHLPISSIRNYVFKYPDVSWNIVVVGSNRKDIEYVTLRDDINIYLQERKLLDRSAERGIYEINQRQLTSGLAEQYCIPKAHLDEFKIQNPETKITRNIVRQHLIKRPTLMLHIIKGKPVALQKNIFTNRIFPAISFVFPRTEQERTKTVLVVANNVYLKKLKEFDEISLGEENE